MLVLSRKVGESIRIGDNISVRLLKVIGDHTVKLGIEAPIDIIVDREEIHTKKFKQGDTYHA